MNFLNLTRPESRVGPGVSTGRPPVPASRLHGLPVASGMIPGQRPAAPAACAGRAAPQAPGPPPTQCPLGGTGQHARLAPSPTQAARRGPALC
jgi:hypothetical protein